MLRNFDVVCIGSAKIDIFLSLHEANKHLRLIPRTRELCLKFGEKITVDKSEIMLGGNAANVAVGLSRFGLKTTIFAEIGDDEFSKKIIKTLFNEHVDASCIKKTNGQTSSFSTIINFKGERTIFSQHLKRKHDFNFDDISTRWVYLTSLGEEWRKAYQKIFYFVKQTKCRLAFNPGTIQLNEGYKNLVDILSLADILFLNKEEAVAILNIKYQRSNIKDILDELKKLGPKITVVTDGKNGSYCLDKDGSFYEHGIFRSKVIEKTGAGDAYSSGFLSAMLQNESIDKAMDWGAKNSSSVIGKIGAQPGLLYKKNLEKT